MENVQTGWKGTVGMAYTDHGGRLVSDPGTGSGPSIIARGGVSGGDIARFIRDQGGDAQVNIHCSSAFPTIEFDRSSGANVWAIGVNSANEFVIADDIDVVDAANYKFAMSPTVLNLFDDRVSISAGEVDIYSPGQAEGTRLFQLDADFQIKGVATTNLDITGFTNVLITGGLNITEKLTLGTGNSADGDILINFDMDRPWTFQSQGNDASNRLVLKSINDKSFVITDTADATMFEFATGNGDFTAVGEVQGATLNASSDVRLKENLSPYIPKPLTFKAHNYDLKTGQKNKIGYLAQEVVKELPGAVSTDDTGMLALDYNMVLVAKIAELEARLDAAGI